jgi:O-antigen/teichoic acid export membrane protein
LNKPIVSARPSIVRNVFSNWGSLVVSIVLSFILAPVIIRSLGDTWYGVWGITMQFSGYLWLLDLGIRDSVVRYVSRNEARRDQDTVNAKVSVAVYLYVIIAILTLLIGVGGATWGVRYIKIDPALVPTVQTVILLTAVNMSLTWLANPFVGMLIGLQRYDLMNAVGVSVAVARFAGTLLMMKAGYGIVGLSVLHVAATCVSGTLTHIICRRLMPGFHMAGLERCRREFKEVWNFSFYIVLNNLASKLVFATDSLIIGSHLPVAAVTYFAIPSSLLQYLSTGMRSMSQVLYPRASSLEGADDKAGLRTLFLLGCKYANLIGLPIAAVFLTIGRDFIRLWIGESYADQSAPVLLILTAAYMMTFPHYTVYYVLLGLGRQRGVAFLRVGEAVANLGLSLFLVRRLGIAGVALGTAIPHVLSMMVVLPIISSVQVGVSLREYYGTVVLPPFAAVVPALALGYFFHQSYPAANFVAFAAQVAAVVVVFALSASTIALSATERAQLLTRARALRPA